MKKNVIFLILAFLNLLLAAKSYGQNDSNNVAQRTIQESPIDASELSTFKELAEIAGIRGLFQGTGPFTLFAPTNAAFAKLGEEKLNNLKKPENMDQLSDLLMNHVVPGKYLTSHLKTRRLKTIGGKHLEIILKDNVITVNGAKVIKADLIGPNGVVHEIDTVLLP